MAKKGQKFKKYSPEFKLSVILDMRENQLGYCETVRKYNLGPVETGGARDTLQRWQRKYLEEGYEGLKSSIVNAIITVLKMSLKSAVETEVVEKQYSDKIRRPKLIQKQIECFSIEEQKN